MYFRQQSILFLVLLSGIFILGCGADAFYEKTYSIDSGSWTYGDNLDFSFEIADTSRIYNLWLEVEHRTDYAFQNLYTRIHTRFPSGQELQEPLSLELADKVGRWYGDCNSNSCTLKIPIQQGAFFAQAGTYQITLEQFMRENPINGVEAISFIVEATEQSRE